MKLILLFLHYVFNRSCKDCIYIRHNFPKKYRCIYYDIPIIEDNNNCSKYKRKNIDW